MSEEYQNQLFRLAAVLYADNNYEVKPRTIQRKIIESFFLESKKGDYTLHQIIDFIQEKYHIVFEEEIIQEIVINENDVFLTNQRNGNLYVSLSEKRKNTLLSKINSKTIDYYIGEFQKVHTQLIANIDSKQLINKFLYEIFSSNCLSFQKLIDNRKYVDGLINIESSNYSVNEKEIINSFLFWDNADKNKAIFDISSYALEYCMLTNKKGASSIQLANLKNKSFYLDTNIIYRALGINGDDRQKRTQTFLKKFYDAGEKLIISNSTNTEFIEGIKAHIEKIRKYNTPRINSTVYQEVKVQQDMFNFYHKWRIGKVNTSLDVFSAEILSLYDSFKKEYNIEIDTRIPYDIDQKNIDQVLNDYMSKISSFKTQEGHEIIGSSLIDAENILWVETKRADKNQNIFDTKYFFISTDQGLRRWDYQRTGLTPIVLLPSQWLTILLRYLDRTEDDFKSFVSFINLKNNEVVISSEKLHIVLAGISEMTDNIVQQRTLLDNLIQNKFYGVIDKDTSNNDIFENAKKYAKSELEKCVEELTKQNEELYTKHDIISKELKEHKVNVSMEMSKIIDDKSGIADQLDEVKTENIKLKNELMDHRIKEEFKKWQSTAYSLLPLGIFIIICIILMFFYENWEFNYPNKLIKWIDSCKNSTQREIAVGFIVGVPAISLIPISILIFKRLISKESKKIKEKDLREGIIKTDR